MAKTGSFHAGSSKVWALALFCTAAPLLFAQTPTATAIPDLKGLSPGEEQQILRAIDSQNNSSTPTTLDLSGSGSVSSAMTPAQTQTTPQSSPGPVTTADLSSGEPQPPTGLTILVLKEGRVTGLFTAADTTQEAIMAAATHSFAEAG